MGNTDRRSLKQTTRFYEIGSNGTENRSICEKNDFLSQTIAASKRGIRHVYFEIVTNCHNFFEETHESTETYISSKKVKSKLPEICCLHCPTLQLGNRVIGGAVVTGRVVQLIVKISGII
jgi:hypothetical protein